MDEKLFLNFAVPNDGFVLTKLYRCQYCVSPTRLQKLFNTPARVISVASSLPKNVHTGRSITLFAQHYIANITPISDRMVNN